MKSGARRTPRESLRLAAELAAKMNVHPLVTGRIGARLEMHFDNTTHQNAVTLTEPDEHLLRSLLMEIRPFLLNEGVGLTSLFGLVLRYVDDPELVHAIESAKHAHSRLLQGRWGRVEVDGHEISLDEATDLWLNGVYFHHDRDKEERLNSLVGPATPLVRWFFLDYMIELTKLAIWTGSVIEEADRRGVIRDAPVVPAIAHPHRPQPPVRPE